MSLFFLRKTLQEHCGVVERTLVMYTEGLRFKPPQCLLSALNMVYYLLMFLLTQA